MQKACRGGSAERAAPQRQGITGNAAVVEGERRRDNVQKACIEGVRQKGRHRNGRESREMLPLWKGNGGGIPCRRPVEGVRQKGRHHNGRESRKMLPLWKGTEEECHPEGLYRGCGRRGGTTTAGNCGKCCRCGMGTEEECRAEGLQQNDCDVAGSVGADDKGLLDVGGLGGAGDEAAEVVGVEVLSGVGLSMALCRNARGIQTAPFSTTPKAPRTMATSVPASSRGSSSSSGLNVAQDAASGRLEAMRLASG